MPTHEASNGAAAPPPRSPARRLVRLTACSAAVLAATAGVLSAQAATASGAARTPRARSAGIATNTTATSTTATATTTAGTTTTGTTTTGTTTTGTTTTATATAATTTAASMTTTATTATVPTATATTQTATTQTATTQMATTQTATTQTATTQTATTATTSTLISAQTQRAGWTQTVTVTVPATSPTGSANSDAAPLSAAIVADDADPMSSTVGVDASTLLAQTALTEAVVSTAPPKDLIPIYKDAGRAFDVPWQVLAAINAVETDYGHDESTSSAGAEGWMQFEPATFAKYALATGDGTPSPYNATDAIFAAAHLLAANGASTDLRKAIYAYNHADWYVDEVTFVAASIVGDETPKSATDSDRIDAMDQAAAVLGGTPYLWGGGHGGWTAAAGYDCSGFVSAVLHAAGYLSEPQTTQTLPAASGIEAGPGRYVTLFDRTDAAGGITEDHVIIDINGQWWESGGGSGDGGADDVHRIAEVSSGYLASFNLELHPKGL